MELQAEIATKQRVAWENALSHLKDMSVDDDDDDGTTSTGKRAAVMMRPQMLRSRTTTTVSV